MLLCLTLSIIRYRSRVKRMEEKINSSSLNTWTLFANFHFHTDNYHPTLNVSVCIYIYIYMYTYKLVKWYLLHSDPPYSFVYYAYKSKFYFLRNAMMIIFCSLDKIITARAHTHTQRDTKKNFFFYSVKLSRL